MGRRKKNATVGQDVKSFTETKEDSLTVFAKKNNTSITQDVIDDFDVKPVGKPNKLGGEYIESFNGKNYRESLKLAYEWKDRYEKIYKEKQINFVNYYPQIFMAKSILISYNTINSGDYNGN